jgi:hypothetical protein
VVVVRGRSALQSHTAGLRDFAVQQRTDNGGWVTVSTGTTSTSRAALKPRSRPLVRPARPCPRPGGKRRPVVGRAPRLGAMTP